MNTPTSTMCHVSLIGQTRSAQQKLSRAKLVVKSQPCESPSLRHREQIARLSYDLPPLRRYGSRSSW
jgi:hypothetical protein